MSDLLKHKLTHYEVLPPEEVWKNIASELTDSSEFFPLSEKIYAFEVAPPVESWSTISLLLKNEATPPVRRLQSMFVKLAAAAVFIGMILVSSVYIFHRQSSMENGLAALPQPKKKLNKANAPVIADKILPEPPSAFILPTIHFNNTSKRSVVRTSNTKRRLLTAAAIKHRFIDLNDNMKKIIVQARLIRNDKGDIIQNPHLIGDDEYISVTGPNGQQTRISSKFANVLFYLNGNENMEDEEWQIKFQDWRSRIMQTSFIPSSSNFLDILELKDFILQDNQQ